MSAVVLPNERNGTVNVSSRRRGAEGQIIVIFALALVAIVAMVGLVIDGGTLFAQQRVAQNGADSAATAGTLVIAENLGAATDIRKEQDVYLAVTQIATKNGLAGLAAEYTDDLGNPIGVNVTADPSATCRSLPPLAVCERPDHAASARPLPASSGSTSSTATAEATVVAGKASGECVLDETDGCTLLPLTFPVQVSQCDSHGVLIPGNWIGAPPPTAPGAPYWPIVGARAATGRHLRQRRRQQGGDPALVQERERRLGSFWLARP